jgi:hypothetical protein
MPFMPGPGDRWADSFPVEAVLPPEQWFPEEDLALNPSYYQAEGFDLQDVIEAFGLGYTAGCAIKYLVRAGRKPGNSRLQDLRKAGRCIERAIQRELVSDCAVPPSHV